MVQFEPGYPAVQAIQSQLDQLDRSIAREEGRVDPRLDRGQHLRGSVHLEGAGDTGLAVLAVSHPVGGDVARVADRQRQDVRRPAEVVTDLEGRGLLALQAVRVERVHEGDGVVPLLRQVEHQLQRPVEVPVHRDHLGTGDQRLHDTLHPDPRRARAANLSQIASVLTDANAALVSAVPGTISQSQINTYISNVATARAAINAALFTDEGIDDR